jgi:hypothetical protein
MKSGNRAAKLDRDVCRKRDKAIAVVFMIDSSTKDRRREVCERAFAAGLALSNRYEAAPKIVSKGWQIPPNPS